MRAIFFDISNWIIKTWETPGKGSSPIMIVENPETGDVFFFKESHQKYETEFWSEIIASKYGQMIGLNVLDYNIGCYKGRLGCLSKRMVDVEKGEILYHGVEVLNDHVETFELTDKPVCSYQDFKIICSKSDFKDHIGNINELIIFDALIGNTDRHTENWAFIKNITAELSLSETNPEQKMPIASNILAKILRVRVQADNDVNKAQIIIKENYSFSPIYDSGCCLGREIQEIKLKEYINDSVRIESYINRGKNEIRWNGLSKGFFELIEILFNSGNKESIKEIFQKITINYSNDKVHKLVNEIDEEVKSKIGETKLTLYRKLFIHKLLTARFEKLKTLIG